MYVLSQFINFEIKTEQFCKMFYENSYKNSQAINSIWKHKISKELISSGMGKKK